MKMKCSKSFIVTVVALVLMAGYFWHRWNERAKAPAAVAFPDARMGDMIMNRRMQLGKPPFPTNNPTPPQSSNRVPNNFGSNY